jgi:zinc protease
MLDYRFQDLALEPDASLVAGGAFYSELVKEKDAFSAVYLAKAGKETQALYDLLIQLEKMRRYGFNASELERVKTEMLTQYEELYNERNTVRNISYAQEYIRHYLDDEVIPGIEWEYKTLQQLLPMIDINTINNIAKQFITDQNVIVSIMAPDNDVVQVPTQKQVLEMLQQVKSAEIEAPVEEEISANLVKKEPKIGKIKSINQNKSLGTTEWILSNGIKVIFKPTEFKQDEIRMSAFSKGGTSLVATEDLASAALATDIIEFSGLADFSMTQLQKVLVGKNVSIGPSISAYREEMNGSSTVKDLETLLQLNYLYFTAPRKDEKAFQSLKEILATQLANRSKNPKAIFGDSVAMIQNNYSPRTLIFDTKALGMVSLEKALEIYKQRFANPADFTFTFVGNIDPNDEQTKTIICKWIGGLKTKSKRETIKDHGVRAPQGEFKSYFQRSMQTKTATNRIQYTSYDMPYTLANDLNMEMLGRILSTRYLESIREREGGSYGVGCSGVMDIQPVPRARLLMQFDTDPLKQAKLMSIIHEEVKTIAKDGPLATDLQKEKESMLKDYTENLEKNSYWGTVLYMYYMYGVNYITDYKKEVEALTEQSVQKTLQQLLKSGNMFEVVMFPK